MYRKDCSIDAKQKWYTISNANVFFIVANTQSDYEILNFVPPNFTISITYLFQVCQRLLRKCTYIFMNDHF